MVEQLISCPKCQFEIPLTDILTSQIAQKLRTEIESATKEKEIKLIQQEKMLVERESSVEKIVNEKLLAERNHFKQTIVKETENRFSLELNDLSEKLREQNTTIEKLKDTELKARKAERLLKEAHENFDRELEAKLEKSESLIKEKLKSEYQLKKDKEVKEIESEKETLDKKLSLLKGELQNEKQKWQESKEKFDELLDEKLAISEQELKKKYDFQKEKEIAEIENGFRNLSEELRKEKNKSKDLELEYIKKQDLLADQKREMEKEFLLKKDDERKKVRDEIQQESKQQLGEKEKAIELLRIEINKLKLKAEQGSQQIQGEVSEEHLKATLKENFYEDIIEDVPVGIQGADIVQKIRNAQGNICGVILWESKNTKTWQDNWIDKLKADQKSINANFSILVTRTLPRNIESFGDLRNVWVTSLNLIIPLAKILRNAIIELHQKDQTLDGKNIKMERLYSFLTSPGFKSRVSDCLESFSQMNEELQKEIRTTKKRWAKREQLIDRVEENILSMYGSFEGIVGNAIPQLEEITNDLLEAGDEEDDFEYFTTPRFGPNQGLGFDNSSEEKNTVAGIEHLPIDEKRGVMIGDVVILDYSGEEIAIQIETTEDDPENGIFNENHPNGKALLGKLIGNIVNIELHGALLQCKILELCNRDSE